MSNVVSFERTTGAQGPVQQTFSDHADRQRLSSTALKAFNALREQWGLEEDAARALSGLDQAAWSEAQQSSAGLVLSQDQLTRMSALIGVFKGLKLLFADSFALEWPKTANSGPLFDGKTPVEFMVHGGIPAMLQVRAHVDALRGGI